MRLAPILLLLACSTESGEISSASSESSSEVESSPPQGVHAQRVEVHVDGEPAADVVVLQPGLPGLYRTDTDGLATVPLDFDVSFEVWVSASHQGARIGAVRVREPVDEPVLVELGRFDSHDNPDYRFQDPGTPFRNDTTAQCAHCHVTINQDWYGSEHAGSASNPAVLDLYAGTAAIFS